MWEVCVCVCVCVCTCGCICMCLHVCSYECVCVCERESVCIMYVSERKSKENIINDHMIIRRGNEGAVPPLRQDNRLQDIPDYTVLTPAGPRIYMAEIHNYTTTQPHCSAQHTCCTTTVVRVLYYSPTTVILLLDHFTDTPAILL